MCVGWFGCFALPLRCRMIRVESQWQSGEKTWPRLDFGQFYFVAIINGFLVTNIKFIIVHNTRIMLNSGRTTFPLHFYNSIFCTLSNNDCSKLWTFAISVLHMMVPRIQRFIYLKTTLSTGFVQQANEHNRPSCTTINNFQFNSEASKHHPRWWLRNSGREK